MLKHLLNGCAVQQCRFRLDQSLNLYKPLFDFKKLNRRNLQLVTTTPELSKDGSMTALQQQLHSLERDRNESACELSWLSPKVFVPGSVSDNGGTLRCISVPETGLRSPELNEDCQSIRSVRRSRDAFLIQMNELDRRAPESRQRQISAKSSTALLDQLEIGVPDGGTEMIAICKNVMSGTAWNAGFRAIGDYGLIGISRNLRRHTLNPCGHPITTSKRLLSRLSFSVTESARGSFCSSIV